MNKRALKRVLQAQRAARAKEHFRYGLLAADTLRAPRAFDEVARGVVDVEVLPQFDGSPDDMFAWLIFQTRDQAEAMKRLPGRREALLAHSRALLAVAGFPANALKTFAVDVTSVPEIEAGGGRFAYFR